MQAYSPEFRRDVLAACDAGQTTRQVAKTFGCSESWVRRVKQTRREEGRVVAKVKRKRAPVWVCLLEPLATAVQEKPDSTLVELKSKLNTSLSLQSIMRALQALKLTYKKSVAGQRTASSRCGRTPNHVACQTSRS